MPWLTPFISLNANTRCWKNAKEATFFHFFRKSNWSKAGKKRNTVRRSTNTNWLGQKFLRICPPLLTRGSHRAKTWTKLRNSWKVKWSRGSSFAQKNRNTASRSKKVSVSSVERYFLDSLRQKWQKLLRHSKPLVNRAHKTDTETRDLLSGNLQFINLAKGLCWDKGF